MASITAPIDKEIIQDGDVSKEEEDYIFNPYNENNMEITEAEVSVILKKYGLPSTFHNFNLYKRAFIHKSYCKRPKIENEENGVIIAERPDDCMPLKTKSTFGIFGRWCIGMYY